MRYDESRYGGDRDYLHTQPKLTSPQVREVQILLAALRAGERTYDQITANQNNYPLVEVILHRFTTDASRTITGFLGMGPGIQVIANVGSNDLVLANDSASSDAQNRILSHTGANITLNPKESVPIIYDRASARVRTIGFV